MPVVMAVNRQNAAPDDALKAGDEFRSDPAGERRMSTTAVTRA